MPAATSSRPPLHTFGLVAMEVAFVVAAVAYALGYGTVAAAAVVAGLVLGLLAAVLWLVRSWRTPATGERRRPEGGDGRGG